MNNLSRFGSKACFIRKICDKFRLQAQMREPDSNFSNTLDTFFSCIWITSTILEYIPNLSRTLQTAKQVDVAPRCTPKAAAIFQLCIAESCSSRFFSLCRWQRDARSSANHRRTHNKLHFRSKHAGRKDTSGKSKIANRSFPSSWKMIRN